MSRLCVHYGVQYMVMRVMMRRFYFYLENKKVDANAGLD